MEPDFQTVTVKFSDNKVHKLTQQQFEVMHFFQENMALGDEVTELEVPIESEAFFRLNDLLEKFNYKVSEPPRVNSMRPVADFLGPEMVSYLMPYSPDQLRRIHYAAKYLKVKNIYKSIAVLFACKVRLEERDTRPSFEAVAKDLGIWEKIEGHMREPTKMSETLQGYKKKFTFVR